MLLTVRLIAWCCFAVPALAFAFDPDDNIRGPAACDPAKVLGSDSCVKCHKGEVEVWKKHPHNQTWETLHRKPEAKAIAQKMGETSIKRSKLCVNCHFTLQGEDGHEKAISGVSCESCHGGAKDWLQLHADYGGPNVTKAQETPEHREYRRENAIAKGMQNPVNIYLIARHCYSCHTVGSEALVNKGGHKAGTDGFELVAWSQGRTRHNFLASNGGANAASPPERLRVMFVVGAMTDLEYTLRSVARATEKATFGITSAKRAMMLKQRLTEIHAAVAISEVATALEALAAVKLKINNASDLTGAADAVGKAAQQFAEHANGKDLAALDALLPTPAQYK